VRQLSARAACNVLRYDMNVHERIAAADHDVQLVAESVISVRVNVQPARQRRKVIADPYGAVHPVLVQLTRHRSVLRRT